ncbi:putative U-box domain-containing protein 50 isoform X1 [Cucumis melo var. makuwa]|uniref:RING-type E3 ubiquitin transferase n=1 Tax=Cucumis melo var. makuwa TaxID=1194695 RepID=A0A5A7T4P4_CUCMM|nr:putative U-box domain-containing protein 50 isoform X1 [Cucumis melo var. makuwa]
MNAKEEKVFVAIGNDLRDGFKTLGWTLRKWKSHPISIVILHVSYNNSMEYVHTPFGKLPVSSVSEEKVEVLRRYEQEKINKILSKYVDFCGKVRAEILKVEKSDKPVHKLIVDLVSELGITNLVIGFTFMKSSSWKPKNAISGSFYIYRNKAHFCELYVIWGGKQVFLRDERIMEDESGVRISKISTKHSLKGWLGKMFVEDPTYFSDRNLSLSSSSPHSSNSMSSQNYWDHNVQELENYYEELLSLNVQEEEDCEQDQDGVLENSSSTRFNILDYPDSNMNPEERIEHLRTKIEEARKSIQLMRDEAKGSSERQAKAEWAINLCSQRTDELEAKIKEEVTIREDLQKELDSAKEYILEIVADIEESKTRLSSLLKLQAELSSKLQISTAEKSRLEAQLEKTAKTKKGLVRAIEELRRQREILHRRIEFCKDRDAMGMGERSIEVSCSTRVYTVEEITLATDNFSEQMRLSSRVYRGRINHLSVAIQMITSGNRLSEDDFQSKVELLSHIHHPHLIAMIGFCPELKCIVFDYMHSGSLSDRLLPSNSNKRSKKICRPLMWSERIRIASEVCSGLSFLHQAQPQPISHGKLTLSKILLDQNLAAKVTGFGLDELDEGRGIELDIRAFGALLLHIVTGRTEAGQIEEVLSMGKVGLVQILDEKAGQWPLSLVDDLLDLALRCATPNGSSSDVKLGTVMEEIDEIKRKADDLVVGNGKKVEVIEGADAANEDVDDVPRIFICPILQEVMKNPHVAADGFSYELEAIEQWIGAGHETSPMTNLKLQHPYLTPNHTLRSLIQDWQNENSNV